MIVAFEADSVGPMMMTIAAWSDVFEISIYPAVTPEEGMQMLQMMNPG